MFDAKNKRTLFLVGGLALLISTPIAVGAALFLAEYAPPWLRGVTWSSDSSLVVKRFPQY